MAESARRWRSPELSLLGEQVRRHDRDRFVTALFASQDRREDLFALYAFNADVAGIREKVSEPMMGLMRLQFWRDLLDGVFEKGTPAPAYPTAEALIATIRRRGLPREPFDTFLNARERDMEDEPPEDREAFLSYARGTGGAIQRLAARVLGAADERTLAVAEQVGTAWAITGLLRAVAFHAAQNRVYLPAADLVGRGIDASTVAAGKHHDAIADVAGELAGEARARLMEARKHRQHIEQCALPALLPAILADGYLKRLQRLRWNVYHPDLGRIDGRPLRLTAAVFLNRY